MMPATTSEQAGDVLRGIGASAGRVTATARVLGGPADFGRLQPGDVLVASITTPAWTPLFARAAAWSPISAARSATARSSPGSTASPPCSAPASRPGGSPADSRSPSTATPAE